MTDTLLRAEAQESVPSARANWTQLRMRWTWRDVGIGMLAIVLGAIAIYAQFRIAGPLSGASGVPEIIDGGSLRIDGRYVSLSGVDAPAFPQTCIGASGETVQAGALAAAHLQQITGERSVACTWRREEFGAGIASCTVAGADIGAQIIKDGWASVSSATVLSAAQFDSYLRYEQAAREANLGIWGWQCRSPTQWRATRSAFSARTW